MEQSHQHIHISPDVLLDIFKFLHGNSLRKCQIVTSQWNHVIQENKQLLCIVDQMDTALFASIKCLKPGRSEQEYQQFCESIRNLLLSDELLDKKKLVEEFALVDTSGYIFTVVAEGLQKFRSTKSLNNPVFFAALKILLCVLNRKFQRSLNNKEKYYFSTKLCDIYKEFMPLIFEEATEVFKQKKDVRKNKKVARRAICAEEVSIAMSIFHIYIALGTQKGNQLDESNLSSISLSLDDLYSFDPSLMTDEDFKLLCSSFHDLLAPAVYDELKSSVSQILNSLEQFQGVDAMRKATIECIRKKFNEEKIRKTTKSLGNGVARLSPIILNVNRKKNVVKYRLL